MIAPPESQASDVARFRVRLLVVLMLVVTGLTGLVLGVVQHGVVKAVEAELQRDFRTEIATLHNLRELRQAALVERCRALVRRPRIHAALEDDALDLLYPSARDELRDLMTPEAVGPVLNRPWHAEFYRFLARDGRVLPPGEPGFAGELTREEEAQLALGRLPDRQQLGYVVRRRGGAEELVEIIALPIVSTETGEVIAALVLGFKPAAGAAVRSALDVRRGIWTNGQLHLDGAGQEPMLANEVGKMIDAKGGAAGTFQFSLGGLPHLAFCERLNAGSLYPAVYEVVVHPLAGLGARQWAWRWRILFAAGVLLIVAWVGSRFLAARLARPVERLARDSAESHAQRRRAEAALEATTEELQRAARFSADASHQLKTPVTVLRAGLEDLLARDHWTPAECHELSALIHQTYRLSSVIEDLLLLSRMDAGRLTIDYGQVDFSRLVEAALDDLGAQPNAAGLAVGTDFPAGLTVAGEERYLALILQNLFENARKYNRPTGRIHVKVEVEAGWARLTIGNTGRTIPAEAQAHIFERFHRGAMGENVPGYGLGLNLARELARLHRGELRLIRSGDDWTEFEVSLPVNQPEAVAT